MSRKISVEKVEAILIATLINVLLVTTANAAAGPARLTDDVEFSERKILIPKTPESNCANSVILDLKSRLAAMGIPFVESGVRIGVKGTFYYPRDTNSKDALGRILVPNRMTMQHGSPQLNQIDFKGILARAERFFQVARPKTHSYLGRVRQLPMGTLLSRYCDSLGADLPYELGLSLDVPACRLSEENFHSAIGMHDGGNSYILRNRDGDQRLIVGESEVIYNLVFLRARGFFSGKKEENFYFSPHQSEKMAHFLDGKGLDSWLEAKSSALVKELTSEEKKSWYHITYQLGYNPSRANGAEGDVIVGKFLSQRAFVEEILLPLDFGVSPHEVVIVPQTFYHLDLFLAPLSQGSLLMPNFEEAISNVRDLSSALKKKKENLAAAELQNIVDETQEVTTSFDIIKKLETTKSLLEKAGFDVTTAPLMVFAKNRRLISAFNPLYGTNPQTGNPFWFVAGISLGGSKGEMFASQHLMAHWKKILVERVFAGSTVEFEFLGAKRKVQRGKDPFFDCRLLHEKMAGLHCLSADIK